LDVAVGEGFHEGQGFLSEGSEEFPSLLDVDDLGSVCRRGFLKLYLWGSGAY
jgi:hypothetical protein